MGASGSGTTTYSIDQSIRFNFSDSAYMSRAVGSGGNTKTWTFSCWFKIGVLGSQRSVSPFLWACHQSDGNRLQLSFDSGSLGVAGDFLSIYDGASASVIFRTNRVFRDPSAWYNLVLVSDTSNSIANDRFRVYVNGKRETSFSTFNAPSLNADLGWNQNGSTYYLGDYFAAHGTYGFDGNIAEMVHIDGQALDPSSFGETNDSGIWIPKDVSGLTFGTKGFYIDGRDSADLGDDESGNGNDFTSSGLAAHDQVLDSPTNNWCVMNPLNTHSSITLSNGNLQSTASAFTGSGASILLPSTGKWYAEIRYNNASLGEYPMIGIYNTIKNLSTSGLNPGNTSGDKDIGFGADGRRNEDSTTTGSWGNAVGDGKIGALAIDMDNKKIWFGHNNSGSFVWQASGDPSAGNNEANTKAFADNVVFGNSHYSGSIVCWNFGQEGTFGGTETAQGNTDANEMGNFYYAPPTNYLALCTKNIGS